MHIRQLDVHQITRHSPNRRKSTVIGITVLLIAAASAAIMLTRVTPRSAFDELTSAAALVDQRVTEGRLEGVPGRPWRKTTSSGFDSSLSSATLRLQAAAASVMERSAPADRSEQHEIAIASVLAGRPRTALTRLQEVARNGTATAAEWITMAAAYLEIGALEGDARAYGKALAAADRALDLAPRSIAAHYNRLAALDGLGLGSSAATEANRYLALDSRSDWAVEVRQRLQRLSRPAKSVQWKLARASLISAVDANDPNSVDKIVRAFPEQARTSGEAEFPSLWAEAFLKGEAVAAARFLQTSRAIGIALRRVNGESLLADSIACIDQSNSRLAVAQAYLAYRAGRQIYASRRDDAGAAKRLAQARVGFEKAQSPMKLVAGYYEAQALFEIHRDDESKQRLEAVFAGLKGGYLALRAQALWHRERMLARSGRQHEALKDTLEAYELCRRLGERALASKLAVIASTTLILLGRSDEGWRMRQRAFRDAMESGQPNIIDPSLNSSARELVLQSDFDVARSFFDVLLERDLSDRIRADAILWRELSDAYVLKRAPDLAKADAAARTIADPVQRDAARDELLFASALLEREERPLAAVTKLTALLDSKQRKRDLLQVPLIQLERARAYRAAGRVKHAAADLRDCTNQIEARGGAIPDLLLQDAFFGHSGGAFEELADLLAMDGDFVGAFKAVDRGRRIGLDIKELTAPEVAAGLPSGVVVAHITSLRNRILLFTFDDGRWSAQVIAVRRERIEELRDALLAAVARGDVGAHRQTGRELFDVLLGQIPRATEDQRPLVIVPDETLASIPFAALVLPSGQFVIENRAVLITPSAGVLGRLSNPVIDLSAAPTTIIVDPAFDAGVFPNLSRLSSAGSEARELGALFPHGSVFAGPNASKRALMHGLQSSEVVHVAAHAIVHDRDASLSLIALAPGDGDGGTLYLREIIDMPVRSRLVVLAACGTAARGGTSGNVGSFASAFLSAGAELVLASLWNVKDEQSTMFVRRFYSRLGEGDRPPEALRAVQLEMLRSHDPEKRDIRAWSAWTLHAGGVAQRRRGT